MTASVLQANCHVESRQLITQIHYQQLPNNILILLLYNIIYICSVCVCIGVDDLILTAALASLSWKSL